MMMRARSSSGFTLLELLLSIGLLAMLLSGMYKIMDSWMQRAVNRTAAGDMMRVQNAAQDYVLANFEPLKLEPVDQFIEMDIEDLKEGNYLPTGYQPRNTFRQRIRVFRRNIEVDRLNPDGTVSLDPDGDPVKIITIEVVTVSDNPSGDVLRIANQRLIDTAQAGGPRMGVVSQMVYPGRSYSGLVTSPFNEWYIQLSDLQAAGYSASPNALGGYLAAYGLVNAEKTDVNDRWLYRVTIDNRPELNRMATNLNMNSHRVENVGTMIADKVNVTGNAVFRGASQGDPNNDTSQAMMVEQAFRADSDTRINMRSTNAAGCTIADDGSGNGNRTLSPGCTIADVMGGELQVVSNSASADAIMTIGELRADGSVITDFTDVDQTTHSRGVTSFTNVNGQDMAISTTVLAPTTRVIGTPGNSPLPAQVQTVQMQTATMGLAGNASVGTAGTPKIKLVAAQMNTGGLSNGNGQTFQTQQMDIANAAEITGETRAAGIAITGGVDSGLYVERVVPAGYTDAYLNRTVVCTQYAPPSDPSRLRTYCEPNGQTYWQSGNFRENCSITANGYTCNHYRLLAGVYTYYGRCTHTRDLGESGQAYHDTVCTP